MNHKTTILALMVLLSACFITSEAGKSEHAITNKEKKTMSNTEINPKLTPKELLTELLTLLKKQNLLMILPHNAWSKYLVYLLLQTKKTVVVMALTRWLQKIGVTASQSVKIYQEENSFYCPLIGREIDLSSILK